MSRITTTVLALLLSILTGASCASSDKEPEPNWTESELSAPTDTILWKIALASAQKMGFPIGAGLDPTTMEFTTGWKTDLHPFKGKGFRTQVHVKMRPIRSGTWAIEARVKKQLNQSLIRPLDLAYAEWEWTGDDVETARILVQHVRSYLGSGIDPVERPADEVEALLERAGLDEDGKEKDGR